MTDVKAYVLTFQTYRDTANGVAQPRNEGGHGYLHIVSGRQDQ